MTKKNKIIICSISLGIVIVGIILAVILVFWKRFDIAPTKEIVYSNCTNAEEMHYPSQYANQSTLYLDATAVIQDTNTLKFGVYNYLNNKVVVPIEYDCYDITEISTINSRNSETIYNLFNVKSLGQISIYSSKGNTNLTKYNTELDVTTAQIKEKNVNIKIKRNNSSAKSKNSFTTRDIEINDIQYVESYYKKDCYNYEIWDISTVYGETFHNLYKVNNDGTRTLALTINNYMGTIPTIDNDYEIVFLKNGDFRLLVVNVLAEINGSDLYEFTIFDEKLNQKNSEQFTIDTLNPPIVFNVGNYKIFQYKIPASSNKYDYCEYNGITTTYYKLVTKKFNLSNGSLSTANFKYVIEDFNDSFNDNTVELYMRKIKNKTLENISAYIVNDRLQSKEITYNIYGDVYKINKSKYLVKSNDYEYTLIEKNYNKICTISNVESFFTTEESIIYVNKNDHKTYICSLDGIIVKIYENGIVSNLHNNKYYGVTITESINGTLYENMYQERLGILNDLIYSKDLNTETYSYNGCNYVDVYTSLINSNVGIIARVKQEDSKYTYTFSNIMGKELAQISGVTVLYNQTDFTNQCTVNYIDNNNILLYFSTGVIGHIFKVNN